MNELVKRAQKGDKDAFISLIEQNKQAMYKVALGILKNDSDAADAIQDTILSCYENLKKLRKPGLFQTWMTKILINHCRRIYKERKSIVFLQELPELSAHDSSTDPLSTLESQDFLRILQRVEDKYRIILLLYYAEDFSIKEIAEILDMNENTVKTRLTRGRGIFKKLYLKEDPVKVNSIKRNSMKENSERELSFHRKENSIKEFSGAEHLMNRIYIESRRCNP